SNFAVGWLSPDVKPGGCRRPSLAIAQLFTLEPQIPHYTAEDLKIPLRPACRPLPRNETPRIGGRDLDAAFPTRVFTIQDLLDPSSISRQTAPSSDSCFCCSSASVCGMSSLGRQSPNSMACKSRSIAA